MRNITNHIATKERFVLQNKAILASPSVILVFFFVVTTLGLFNNPMQYVVGYFVLGWFYLTLFTGLAWALFYFGYGNFGWQLARWNIPLSVSLVCFAIVVTGVPIAIFFAAFHEFVHVPLATTELLKVFFLTLLGAYTVIAFKTDQMKTALCTDGRLFPIWLPLTKENIEALKTMPEIFTEDVVMIRSFNQYIEVITEHKKQDIRMSLKDAVALFDEALGLRIHRSYWVRKSEIEELSYKNGNPFVTLRNGQAVPVGRQMVEPVKSILGTV